MRSNHSYLQLATAIAVSCSLILSACQLRDQSVEAKYANGGKGSTELSKPTNGRAILTPEMEKNKVDVTTLESYKTNLAPLFDKLTESSGVSWNGIAKLKTWLIGPIDLKHLPVKHIAGADSSEDIPISRQSVYEIWIDSTAVEDYSDQAKASLVLHEILTSIYLMRGFKNLELCNLAMAADRNNEDCRARAKEADMALAADEMKSLNEESKSLANKTMDAHKKRIEQAKLKAKFKNRHTSLKEEDYDNIVAVKNYIEKQGDKLNYKALMTKMGENDFDLRVFSIKLKETEDLTDTP